MPEPHARQRAGWRLPHMRWLLLALISLLWLGASASWARSAGPSRAGVVVKHGDGHVSSACVSFSEPEISGLDLLERSGLIYVAQESAMGAAICKLDGEGCDYPGSSCFCKCQGADCVYWAYQQLRGGAWAYAQTSPSRTRVHDGDVDGWAWGSGSVQNGAQPPLLAFGDICPVDDASATAASPATRVSGGHTPPSLQSPTASILLDPTPAPPAGGSGAGGYVLFGAFVVVMLGAIAVVSLRRRDG